MLKTDLYSAIKSEDSEVEMLVEMEKVPLTSHQKWAKNSLLSFFQTVDISDLILAIGLLKGNAVMLEAINSAGFIVGLSVGK